MKTGFKFALVAVVLFSSVVAQKNRNTFTDSRDGKTYRMVTIGNQTWMAQNLNFATDEGSLCYDDDESNCNTYGRLYDWNTAMTACPAGWRLPTNRDWRALINAIGGDSVAGNRLRSRTGWTDSRHGNGTDDYGFAAMPGGHVFNNRFGRIGETVGYWTANEDMFAPSTRGGGFMTGGCTDDCTNAYVQGVGSDAFGVGQTSYRKTYGWSVRCVRDEGQ